MASLVDIVIAPGDIVGGEVADVVPEIAAETESYTVTGVDERGVQVKSTYSLVEQPRVIVAPPNAGLSISPPGTCTFWLERTSKDTLDYNPVAPGVLTLTTGENSDGGDVAGVDETGHIIIVPFLVTPPQLVTSVSPCQFSRTVLGPYASHLTDAEAAARYVGSGQILQATESHVIGRLRDIDPTLPFWIYLEGILSIPSEFSPWGFLTTYTERPEYYPDSTNQVPGGPTSPPDPSWFLCDAKGDPLKMIASGSNAETNLFNPLRVNAGLGDAYVEHATWLLEQYCKLSPTPDAPTGLFLDDITANVSQWWLIPKLGLEFPYDENGDPLFIDTTGKFDVTQWQTANFDWIDEIAVRMRALGWQVICNCGGAGVDGYQNFWRGCIDRLDGAMDEFFADANYCIDHQIDNLTYSEATGKRAYLNFPHPWDSNPDDWRKQDCYAQAAMMMSSYSLSSLGTSHSQYNGSADSEIWWTSEFNELIALGNPLGPCVVLSGSLRSGEVERPFAGGKLRINTSSNQSHGGMLPRTMAITRYAPRGGSPYHQAPSQTPRKRR